MIPFKVLSRFTFGLLFIFGGFNHFWHRDLYMSIMPPYLPYHSELVAISGIAEIGLGSMLFVARFVRFAAWGLIALLIAIFPANLQMALHPEQYRYAHPIILYLRLPLQALLIAWAYSCTRPDISQAAIDAAQNKA